MSSVQLSHESSNFNIVFTTLTLEGATTRLRSGFFNSRCMSLSILDFAPQVVSLEIVYLSYDIPPRVLAAVNLSQWPWKMGPDPVNPISSSVMCTFSGIGLAIARLVVHYIVFIIQSAAPENLMHCLYYSRLGNISFFSPFISLSLLCHLI